MASPPPVDTVKVKVEAASDGASTVARSRCDPTYHALAQLSYDSCEYDILYSKYMDKKWMESEMESQTRRGSIRFSYR